MQQIEFTVDNTALATVKDLEISANFAECEAALTEMVSPYASLVVTEDGIASAKSDLAQLRKISKSISDYRISVKKAYSAPITAFEEKCKALTAIIDTGIENINGQVKSFEAAQKQAKIDGLRAYFDAHAGEAAEFIGFEQIRNPKWENNGFSVDDAQKEIDGEITKTVDSVAAIRAVSNEFVPSLLQEYTRCHDLVAVLKMNQNLIARKEAEEQRRAAEKAAASEKAQQTPVKNTPTEDKHEEDASYDRTEEETVYALDFRVFVTKNQLSLLKNFLNSNGIKYGRVPD